MAVQQFDPLPHAGQTQTPGRLICRIEPTTIINNANHGGCQEATGQKEPPIA